MLNLVWILVAMGMWLPVEPSRSLVIIDNVIDDGSNRKKTEVYRAICSAQVQSNAAKLIGRCFTVQIYDPQIPQKQP